MVFAAVLTFVPILLAGSVIPRDLPRLAWYLAVVAWSLAFAAIAWWLAGRIVARWP